MVNKNENDSEIASILASSLEQQSRVKDFTFQSSKFRIIFCFVNLYAVLIVVVYFLVKGDLVEGINTNFVNGVFLTVLNGRTSVFLLLFVSLNLSAYYNFGFKIVCLTTIIYMLNSAVDNIVLFSDSTKIIDRPYFSAFIITRPLFVIALVGLFILHKEKAKND